MFEDAELLADRHRISPPRGPTASDRAEERRPGSPVDSPLALEFADQAARFRSDEGGWTLCGADVIDAVRGSLLCAEVREPPVTPRGVDVIREVLRAVAAYVVAAPSAGVAVEIVSPPPACLSEGEGDEEFFDWSTVSPEAVTDAW